MLKKSLIAAAGLSLIPTAWYFKDRFAGTSKHSLGPIGNKLYEGSVNADGKPHGYGCAFFEEGAQDVKNLSNGPSLHCGQWVDGMRTGPGTFSSESGEAWKTNFIDGKMNGEVFYSTKEGFFMVGNAVDNEIRGDAIWVGEVDLCSVNFGPNGPQDPNGLVMSDNGHVYKGPYVNGKKNGVGEEISLFNSTRIAMAGRWNEDTFEEGVIKIKIPESHNDEFDEAHISLKDGFIHPDSQYYKKGNLLKMDNSNELLASIFAEYMDQISGGLDIREAMEKKADGSVERCSWMETDKGPLVLSLVKGTIKDMPTPDGTGSHTVLWEGTDSHFHPGSGISIKMHFADGRPWLRQASFPDNTANWVFSGLHIHNRSFEAEWKDPFEWIQQRLPTEEDH
eukprot:TRINITY_DN6844_c0_g1_i1.p1 TRINITY_DN6844_c0_g1~~TRINITY_DN6844_c0_g1_i1.p1  ORF type:complete len:393 (+),score=91.24 TRINITY_DN6844_c0_g1_i1:111-1289(+)